MPRATKPSTKTIRQSATFKATPRQVYEALMDSRQHSRFTGGAARISRRVGGAFSTFGGYATGRHMTLVPGRTIVQTWRASDWPEGHYSTATFALSRVRGGTRLVFTQRGVPARDYESIKQGWIDYYWTPLRALLER